MKNTFIRKKNQAWSKENAYPKQEIVNNPFRYIEDLTPSEQGVFHLFIWETLTRNWHTFGHKYIAAGANCSVSTVKRAITKFKKDGVLITNYQHLYPSQYKISKIFEQPATLQRLSWIFPSLKAFLLAMLIPFGYVNLQGKSKNELQVKDKVITKVITNSKYQATVIPHTKFKQHAYGDYVISPVIHDIWRLNLSLAGKVFLTPFHNDAIKYAHRVMKHARNIRKPYDWFFKLCLQWHSDRDLIPDWSYSYRLAEFFKVSKSDPMLIDPGNKNKTTVSGITKPQTKVQPKTPNKGKAMNPPVKVVTHYATKQGSVTITKEPKVKKYCPPPKIELSNSQKMQHMITWLSKPDEGASYSLKYSRPENQIFYADLFYTEGLDKCQEFHKKWGWQTMKDDICLHGIKHATIISITF